MSNSVVGLLERAIRTHNFQAWEAEGSKRNLSMFS
jgi:hypothetical protein